MGEGQKIGPKWSKIFQKLFEKKNHLGKKSYDKMVIFSYWIFFVTAFWIFWTL